MYLIKTTKGGSKKLRKQQIERKLKTYTGKVGVEGIPNTGTLHPLVETVGQGKTSPETRQWPQPHQ